MIEDEIRNSADFYTPKKVNMLFQQYFSWYFDISDKREKIAEKLNEKPFVLSEYNNPKYLFVLAEMGDLLEAKAKMENSELLPLITVIYKHAPVDILKTGFERVFVGQQIKGENLQGNGSSNCWFMTIFDEITDQIQSMERFAAIINGKVTLVDIYSDPRTPVYITGDPKALYDGGWGREFNLDGTMMPRENLTPEEREIVDSYRIDYKTYMYEPDTDDETNRTTKFMNFVNNPQIGKVTILGHVDLPELGNDFFVKRKIRVPIFGNSSGEKLFFEPKR
jgi:hypothetical protein